MVEDRNGCYLLRLRCISILPRFSSLLALRRVAHTIPLVYSYAFSSPRHSSSSLFSSYTAFLQLSRSSLTFSLSLSLSSSFLLTTFSFIFLLYRLPCHPLRFNLPYNNLPSLTSVPLSLQSCSNFSGSFSISVCS